MSHWIMILFAHVFLLAGWIIEYLFIQYWSGWPPPGIPFQSPGILSCKNLLEISWKMKIFIQRYIFFQNGQEFVDQTMKTLNNQEKLEKICKYILITYIFRFFFQFISKIKFSYNNLRFILRKIYSCNQHFFEHLGCIWEPPSS